jgi:AraC-like DNA-binding protein
MTQKSSPSTNTFRFSAPVIIPLSCWGDATYESASLKLSIGPSNDTSSSRSSRARWKSLLVQASKKLSATCAERAWTVGLIASEVALSRSAFAARFREFVGESPKRYITRMRLGHAASLLSKTDAPLAEIATVAGYATEFSFSKAFKRTFGVAPGAYRGAPNGVPALTLASGKASSPA